MAANIHCLLDHFWMLWEEQSPSCIRNWFEPPCDHSGTLWRWLMSPHCTSLGTTSLVLKWLCCYWNWNKFHGFFFQLEEQDSVLKGDFVLWRVNVCLFHAGVEVTMLHETRLDQSGKEMCPKCAASLWGRLWNGLSLWTVPFAGSQQHCLEGSLEVELPHGKHRCSNPGSWSEVQSELNL